MAILLFSCGNRDAVEMVLSMVSRRGLKNGEEEGISVKLPPLLEEELALTACRTT